MKDYAQYTSRIPSPNSKRTRGSPTKMVTPTTTTKTTTVRTSRNVKNHPLSSNNNSNKIFINGNKNKSSGIVGPKASSSSSSLMDKRERESTSTASSSSQSSRQQAPQHQFEPAVPTVPSVTPTSLNASDALSLRQHGTEATVVKLRQSLDEANSRDATAKASLAKSDAVILELRGSVRNLKKQLDSLKMEKEDQKQKVQANSSNKIQQLQQQIQGLQDQLHKSQHSNSKDEKIGEMQTQLDRAHAQIITADMVRKELEDTLEAEQYTWELRIQDQERTIAQLQQECDTLAHDLETCRSQWKEAEQGWNSQVEELQQQLSQARTRMATTQALQNAKQAHGKNQDELVSKITQLEKERAELQSCLDEALKELEAVDAELRPKGDSGDAIADLVEPMQRLLRWILQEQKSTTESGGNNNNSSTKRLNPFDLSKDPKELLRQIQETLEEWIAAIEPPKTRSSVSAADEVADLKNQVIIYQDELKSREESSAELRESLKEAVALLKPLQDTVAKVEAEKQELQSQLDDLERQRFDEAKAVEDQLHERNEKIQSLQDQVSTLEQEVREQKDATAAARKSLTTVPTSPNFSAARRMFEKEEKEDSVSKIQKAREELRRKRESEGKMQQLLKDAQSRFHSLHQQNEDVAARNRELQGKLKSAEDMLSGESAEHRFRQILAQKDAEISALKDQLRTQSDPAADDASIDDLKEQLNEARQEIAKKEQAEQVLNGSLKEALGLLKPLQMHLEDAEKEKMEISRELRNLRKRFRQLQMGEYNTSLDDQSRSAVVNHQDVSIELIKMKEELEETVRLLELENSQLHDALEDLSESHHNTTTRGTGGSNSSINGTGSTTGTTSPNEVKLHQQIVELNHRYETTQNRLEDANVENHALVKALKQSEVQDDSRKREMKRLQDKLVQTENELHNAKAIARSALVKVEELTMANVEQLSLSREGSMDLNHNNHSTTSSPISATRMGHSRAGSRSPTYSTTTSSLHQHQGSSSRQ